MESVIVQTVSSPSHQASKEDKQFPLLSKVEKKTSVLKSSLPRLIWCEDETEARDCREGGDGKGQAGLWGIH